ncbi:MAG: hypothetical protein WC898_00215 [Candidatus Paceibacterota bacterium]|jgi:D-alanyl-D-alanine carboxypeptidase (penicillin-binding protein 5/6)
MKNEYERGLVTTLAILIIFSSFFFYNEWKIEKEIEEKRVTEEERLNIIRNTLESLTISAKAISVYDDTDSVKIYGKNDDKVLPIASLVKTLTILTSLKENGTEKVVSITPSAIAQNGDFGLFVNEKWRIGDLSKLTIISSANDGAFILSEISDDFMEKMRITANEVGMKDFLILNSTGLDILTSNSKSGASARAEDINKLNLFALWHYPRIFISSSLSNLNLVSESGFSHNATNTNLMIGKIPNLLFSKTGNTELAGGNLSIIFKDKREHIIAITILGSTSMGRFTDMEKIIAVLSFF